MAGMANKKGKMGERFTLNPKGGKPLGEAFDQFIQAKTVMNVSEETVKHYQVCYKYFTEFFGKGHNCDEVSEQTIFDYLAHIRKTKPNIKQKTVSTYIRGLRTAFYFMMENGWMDEFKITLPRVEEASINRIIYMVNHGDIWSAIAFYNAKKRKAVRNEREQARGNLSTV